MAGEPDSDLRYRIAELLCRETAGRARHDGYDYDDARLLIFLEVDISPVAAELVRILGTSEISGNAILDEAIIGVSSDARTFEIVRASLLDRRDIHDRALVAVLMTALDVLILPRDRLWHGLSPFARILDFPKLFREATNN